MHWEFANEREDEEPIATKWLKKIAQGFNPGYSDPRDCALKAPDGGPCVPRFPTIQNFETFRSGG
jgi:hypothetical protein